MKPFLSCLVFALALSSLTAHAKSFKDMFPMIHSGAPEEYRAGLDAMDLKEGTVDVDEGLATLEMPDGYYFLGPKDARYVLEEMWGNPPKPDTLGIVFPKNTSPFHQGSWALEIFFDPVGYVSDSDAGSYDYDALLSQMKSDSEAENKDRQQAGYGAVHLIGWAAPPHYDAATRKLYWAKRLQFEGDETETLNYNIRVLGRRGVLVLNFIADVRELGQVEAALPDVLKMVSFKEGHRYADFMPGADTVAAVGIGGLIAGKVLAKTGLLVLLLAFAKKFIFLLLIPVAMLWQKVKSLFSGGRNS